MLLNLKTKYSFGKNAAKGLSVYLQTNKFKKALILTGNNSAKVNGSLSDIIHILSLSKLDYREFSGIESNPKVSTIDKAIAFGKKEKVDLIIAIGGGSVIDAAKVIGFLIENNHLAKESAWQYVVNGVDLKNSKVYTPLKIVAVLTLAGTGSENNCGSVITNDKTHQKLVVRNHLMTPELAILDPSYTFTVNNWQLASAGFDCLAHLIETYMGNEPTFGWQQEYLFANMRNIIKYLPLGLKEGNKTNFDIKANIMFTSSFSLNDLSTMYFAGYCEQDWSVHLFEHALSALYNVSHGAGLALLFPTYLSIMEEEGGEEFKRKWSNLSKTIFGASTYAQGVEKLVEFIELINLPTKLSDFKEIMNFNPETDALRLSEHVQNDPRLSNVSIDSQEKLAARALRLFAKLGKKV